MQATITGTNPSPASSILSALSALDGGKTYISIGLGVAYVLYCQYISRTPVDPAIAVAIGGMILAALRSAMKTNNAKVVDAVAVGASTIDATKAEPIPALPAPTPDEIHQALELLKRIPQ